MFNAAYEERFGARYLGRVLDSVLKGVGLGNNKREDDTSHDPEREKVLKEAFGLFDRNNDGFVSVQELQLVLKALGMKEGRHEEKCQKMINDADENGDGKLDYEEFKKLSRQMRR